VLGDIASQPRRVADAKAVQRSIRSRETDLAGLIRSDSRIRADRHRRHRRHRRARHEHWRHPQPRRQRQHV